MILRIFSGSKQAHTKKKNTLKKYMKLKLFFSSSFNGFFKLYMESNSSCHPNSHLDGILRSFFQQFP